MSVVLYYYFPNVKCNKGSKTWIRISAESEARRGNKSAFVQTACVWGRWSNRWRVQAGTEAALWEPPGRKEARRFICGVFQSEDALFWEGGSNRGSLAPYKETHLWGNVCSPHDEEPTPLRSDRRRENQTEPDVCWAPLIFKEDPQFNSESSFQPQKTLFICRFNVKTVKTGFYFVKSFLRKSINQQEVRSNLRFVPEAELRLSDSPFLFLGKQKLNGVFSLNFLKVFLAARHRPAV